MMRQPPPGQLKPGAQPDVIMMICTAGHVDHGKTQLVKLLTGCRTDRLKAELDRGLTIELGYAPCFLEGDLCVGIVDVPGHRKFIRNMVAGVSGIEMTVLVIAADDGIMPQTVEHVQIMELLGVSDGVVALTKTDLVSEGIVRQRVEEIEKFLSGTFLADAPVCPVSSETGAGVAEFHHVLLERITAHRVRHLEGVFRMPVERVFTRKGHGLVVTGIPLRGTIRVGDSVECVPGNLPGHVRGMQCFLRDSSEGGTGQCLALNIPELGKDAPARGDVVTLPGVLRPARIFHVRARRVQGLDRPLKNAEEIKFHTGTAEVPGKVYLLEKKKNTDSPRVLATVVLADECPVAAGDRFILRRPSPAATVAGGEILAVCYQKRRPRRKQALAELTALEAAFAGILPGSPRWAAAQVEYCLRTQAEASITVREIARFTLLPVETVRREAQALCQSDSAVSIGEERYIAADRLEERFIEADTRIREIAGGAAIRSVDVSELRAGFDWPGVLWDRVFAHLSESGLAEVSGNRVVLRVGEGDVPESDRKLIDAMVRLYDRTGYSTPRPDEVPEQLNMPPKETERILDFLCDTGRLVRLSPKVVLTREHFKAARQMVIDTIREQGSLESSDFKAMIQSSRKYALAVLDYLDLQGVTVRRGSTRTLASAYAEGLD